MSLASPKSSSPLGAPASASSLRNLEEGGASSGTIAPDDERTTSTPSVNDVAATPAKGQNEKAKICCMPRPYWQPVALSGDEGNNSTSTSQGRSLGRLSPPCWQLLVPSVRRCLLILLCITVGIALLAAGWFGFKAASSTNSGTGYPSRANGLVSGCCGAVAAEEGTCSDIGLAVLKDNGSAVDAAIASGICTGVMNSFSSGIGGGGFMVIRLPDGEAEFIDFREKAPAASTECMFCNNSQASQIGGLAVAVPGELAGYELAHKRHGRLPWARLLQPSIDLCEQGFAIGDELYSRMKISDFLLTSPGFREVYTMDDPNGSGARILKPAGSLLMLPKLAKTLQTVATMGAQAFYTGEIAQSIVRTVGAAGGILTLADMSAYQPIIRQPLVGYYRGRKIITSPPPASGAALLLMLNILDGYGPVYYLGGFDPYLSGVNAVRMVESAKWAFAARTELGDPDFLNITERVAEIIDKGHAGKIRAEIKDDRTFPIEHYRPQFDFIETPGTTHISAVDKDDMAVAVTSTINLAFGAKLMDEESGVILNNEMDDFSSPNMTNAFGLPPSKNNHIKPGKRPLSSSVPTIIEKDGRFDAAYGASGGSRILTAVFQAILNVVDRGMNPYIAVASPRWHHQLMPDILSLDFDFPQEETRALFKAGYNITMQEKGYKGSEVQVVQRLQDGRVNGASDPRKHGRAAAY